MQPHEEKAEDARLHPGQISHRKQHRHERHGRAEIRFLGDERERQARQGARNGEVDPGRRAPILAEELRQHERHADLRELRRLQVERAERNPAPRPHLHVAHEEDVEQGRQQADVDQMGLVGERPVVDRQRHQHRADPEHDRIELRHVEMRRRRRRARRAVDHGHPDRAQCEDGDEQRPVDVVVEAAFEHSTFFVLRASTC